MNAPPLGLYIHLPWCERKCPYCDFNSHESDELHEAAYIAALLRDLEEDHDLLLGRVVETVFIGGGTPSLFGVDAIAKLLAGIAGQVALTADAEITMEANPGSAEADRFRGFREAGVNRLSIGVQSFDDNCLAALGRVHDSTQACAALEYAVAANFDSFNIDLMHGLPGQTKDSAIDDLRHAVDSGAGHLSWYQLTIEPNTVFNKRHPELPAEDVLADIQDTGEALLARAGFSQYEISAYSRPNTQCRHNLNYWRFGDYLGIGAGAHGKVTLQEGRVQRYSKRRQPEDYLAASAGAHTASSRVLDAGELPGEFMMNALRLNEGFAVGLFEQRTGLAFDLVRPRVESLCERGLLERHGEHVKTSDTGRRFLDAVVAEFI
jgi:oxygen-independent coproporphyrinogen-3 oxidase